MSRSGSLDSSKASTCHVLLLPCTHRQPSQVTAQTIGPAHAWQLHMLHPAACNTDRWDMDSSVSQPSLDSAGHLQLLSALPWLPDRAHTVCMLAVARFYLSGSMRSTRTPWQGTGRVSLCVKVPREAGSTRSRTATCFPSHTQHPHAVCAMCHPPAAKPGDRRWPPCCAALLLLPFCSLYVHDDPAGCNSSAGHAISLPAVEARPPCAGPHGSFVVQVSSRH